MGNIHKQMPRGSSTKNWRDGGISQKNRLSGAPFILQETATEAAAMNIAQVKALLEQEPVRAVPEGVSEDPKSMDIYNTVEQEESIVEASARLKELRWYMRVWVFLVEEQSWLFLFVLGTFGALVVLFVDFSIDMLLNSRTLAVDVIPWPALRVLVWCVTGVGLALVAGMCAHIISPHAAGSGIPEMKCILSGMSLTHYLSFRTFFAKCLGLTCAISSGLSVGKEGPYVHICSILSHQLTRMPMFRRVAKNDALRLQMIGAGCAVGVATTFGAPLGGVLFSIEVTSTYYLVHHLWKVGFFFLLLAAHLRRRVFTAPCVGRRWCGCWARWGWWPSSAPSLTCCPTRRPSCSSLWAWGPSLAFWPSASSPWSHGWPRSSAAIACSRSSFATRRLWLCRLSRRW